MMSAIMDTKRTMEYAIGRRGRSILQEVAEFHAEDFSAFSGGSAVLFAEDYQAWHGDDCGAWLERVCTNPACPRCAEKRDLSLE